MSQELSSSVLERGDAETGMPEYLTIPIPPRNSPPFHGRRLPSLRDFIRSRLHWRSRRHIPLSPEVRKRRAELAQAMGIAILVNLALVPALLLIHVDRDPEANKPFFIATAATETDAMDDAASSEGPSTPAATSHRPSAAERGSMTMTSSLSVTVTAPSPIPIHQQLESVAMPDPTALLGQSMSKTDFAAIERQHVKRAKDFVESKGAARPARTSSGQAVKGVGTELLAMIFRGDRLGDGSNAVVYLDISGSMRRINADVRRYMESRFPNALVREIRGCAMNRITDPFPAALLSDRSLDQRTEFYFVCDLQDGVTGIAVKALERFVTSGDLPRHLHLVSFDKVPRPPLLQLLEDSGGSFLHLPPEAR